MRLKYSIPLIFILVLILYHVFHLEHYLTLDFLKKNRQLFQVFYFENKLLTKFLFLLIYIISTMAYIPGVATILSLFAGAIFGVIQGTIIVSFASTIGATGAFLTSRYLFRKIIQKKYQKQYEMVDRGLKKDGSFYLLTLRLTPVVPFFLINLVMGLTSIKTLTYFIVSQIGMLPATIVYVNAGSELSKLESLTSVLSPRIILSFTLIGIFPWLAKWILSVLRDKNMKQEKIN
jgi:uncharacterized membrane protein YdjX (TVP38/TMEM64 family)